MNQRTPFGVVRTSRVCDACGGKGKTIETPCSKCRGTGKVRTKRTVDVDIPAGINGEILQVSGHGNAGINNGPYGDLHVRVEVRPHPILKDVVTMFGVKCQLLLHKQRLAERLQCLL